ncbi:MAG: NCS2 family permease [Planctomycetaceae bacterium]|nr:NCS2 family permease [Planctomycetaceae bacterium]
MSTASSSYPLFVRRDLDGFFGLFIDNLVQLLAMLYLCATHCGMSGEAQWILLDRILPGAAISLLLGNVFYAWQAHRLAARENRSDVTALPYGINTPSLLVYVFFVMGPVFRQAQEAGATQVVAAELAWKMGLVACLGSGLIELLGAAVAERIRRSTPRAALLSTLAGIAIGFISMTFALQVFQRPLVAMLPLGIVLITYFSRKSFPLNVPGGLVAVVAGTACAWLLTGAVSIWPEAAGPLTGELMQVERVREAIGTAGLRLPVFTGAVLWDVLSQPGEWVGFLSVIVPMGLFNVVGSLQNIESAEAGGDRFGTSSSMAVNGLGTIAASLFGSCFPTTIYIGHPGWKGLGARAGYSTLNGIAVTAICLTGTVAVIGTVVPIEAGIAIVLWIGIVITAQAFQATSTDHAPAVAIGLFPAIAAWGMTVVQGAFLTLYFASDQAIPTLQSLLTASPDLQVNGFFLHGLITVERGYIFTCMILASISAHLIDGRFRAAALWSLVAALFTASGLMHAWQLAGNSIDFLFLLAQPDEGTLAYRAMPVAAGYLLMAVLFALFGLLHRADQSQDSEAGLVETAEATEKP